MTRVPRSIGIIPDGHRRGMEKVEQIVAWAHEAGIEEVWLYAFSTENWQRPEEEVEELMKLCDVFCEKWLQEKKTESGHIRFIGERERLPAPLQEKMRRAEAKGSEGPTLVIALSYGGRAEIVAAVNTLLSQGVSQVDEKTFADTLWSSGLTDPDLIIRTGGEKRLSNFLPWQSIYSELFFIDTKFPALTKGEFKHILEEYGRRERRHGV